MEQLLRDGLTALGLDPAAAPALARYGELLLEKNRVMNLTAITDPAGVAALHFLDSAALLTLADFRGKTVGNTLRRKCCTVCPLILPPCCPGMARTPSRWKPFRSRGLPLIRAFPAFPCGWPT